MTVLLEPGPCRFGLLLQTSLPRLRSCVTGTEVRLLALQGLLLLLLLRSAAARASAVRRGG